MRRAGGSENWLLLSRSVLTFLKKVLSYMLRRLTTGVCVLLLRLNLSDTSFSVDLLYAGILSVLLLHKVWNLRLTLIAIYLSVFGISGRYSLIFYNFNLELLPFMLGWYRNMWKFSVSSLLACYLHSNFGSKYQHCVWGWLDWGLPFKTLLCSIPILFILFYFI